MEKSQDKKEESSSTFSAFLMSLLSSIKDRIMQGVDAVLDPMKERVLQGVDAVLDHFEERVLMLQKKMLRHIFIMFCIGAGIAAFLLSLSFYLIDVLQWPRYLIFLVLGFALLIIASISVKLKY